MRQETFGDRATLELLGEVSTDTLMPPFSVGETVPRNPRHHAFFPSSPMEPQTCLSDFSKSRIIAIAEGFVDRRAVAVSGLVSGQ